MAQGVQGALYSTLRLEFCCLSDRLGGATMTVADVVGMEGLSPTVLSEADFFLFWAGKLFVTHTRNERNHKRQMEGHSQPKLQVTVTTWKRQTLKSAESQHVKQNKPSTRQLFTKSKHSLSKNKQLCINSGLMTAVVSTLHTA